jgi:hypothetical protein
MHYMKIFNVFFEAVWTETIMFVNELKKQLKIEYLGKAKRVFSFL